MKRSWMMGAAALALALPQPALAVTDEEMAQIRASIRLLEQRRAEDQARIADLERRLKQADDDIKAARMAAEKAQTTATTAAAPVPPPGAAPPAMPAPAPARSAAGGGGFNPAIGVVLNGTYGHFTKDPATATVPGFALGDEAGIGDRGLSLGESEVSLSANIDHVLYGELTVAYTREGTAAVEEAYIQSTALPGGFTAKAGRFFSGIGYMNDQHAHVWDFVDAALPYRAMLNGQYGDDGVQVKWLAPTDRFVEFGAEAFRGDRFPATAIHNGRGAYSGYVHVGGDFGLSHSWLAGLSYLHADAGDRATGGDLFTGRSNLAIGSLVWKWAPDGNPVERNLKLQGEYFHRRESGSFNSLGYRGRQNGWYAQAVYQFMPQWRIGARYDQVRAGDLDAATFGGSTLDNRGMTSRRQSALLEYDTSEFGRFRLQFNRDRAAPEANNELFLNYVVSLGAHGAHKF